VFFPPANRQIIFPFFGPKKQETQIPPPPPPPPPNLGFKKEQITEKEKTVRQAKQPFPPPLPFLFAHGLDPPFSLSKKINLQ